MKPLVVYYSMLGNTDFIAKILSEKLNAELLRIEPQKAYPDKGFKKFFYGGKSAVMGEMPKLDPYCFEPDKYDTVIIGTPVWASNISPPVRSFIYKNKDKLNSKIIASFMCSSGGNTKKAFGKLTALLDNKQLAAEMSLIDPKERYNESVSQSIDKFCAELFSVSI